MFFLFLAHIDRLVYGYGRALVSVVLLLPETSYVLLQGTPVSLILDSNPTSCHCDMWNTIT